MVTCGHVCGAWRDYTKRYMHNNLHLYKTLRSQTEVLRFSQLMHAGILHDMKSVTISGSISASMMNRSLAHITALAAMLAGNVPRALHELRLKGGEWMAEIPQNVFLHLT